MTAVFDRLVKHMEGFYIGRFDVRTASLENLLKGEFRVIEVNGANSEPAHIYDPKHTIWFAWKELFNHWTRLFEISVANHLNGVPYASFRQIRSEIVRHNRHGAKHI